MPNIFRSRIQQGNERLLFRRKQLRLKKVVLQKQEDQLYTSHRKRGSLKGFF